MAISAALRQKIRDRDDHCLHCGSTENLVLHHRRNRGYGGSKLLDRADNLLRVCAALNYAMESDANIANEAKDMGWKLGQWQDFSQPVFDRVAMTWWRLDERGGKEQVEPPMYLV